MTTDEIKQRVADYAWGYGINPSLALAQINRESGFNPNANGSSGERGLAQFMPGTWARFGYGDFSNAYDVDYNLWAWGEYMAYLSGLFGGDMSKALQAYNGGEGHLLNPDRYGPPSQAAQTYASEIIAQAGDWPNVQPSGAPLAKDNSGANSSTVWIAIGAAALLLFVFSD